MKTETERLCQTLSDDLENFYRDINGLRRDISELEASIRDQVREIESLEIENDQLQSLASTTQLRGGIGGAAAGAAARFKMTQNTIKISRLEAEVASARREIEDKKFQLQSWTQSAEQAVAKIKELDCPF